MLLGERRGPHPPVDPGLHGGPVPTRGCVPGVLLLEVPALGLNDRVLVPEVVGGDGVAHRIGGVAWLPGRPLLVEGVGDVLLAADVDLVEVGRLEDAVADDPGGRPPPVPPHRRVGIGGVVGLGVIPDPGLDEVARPSPDPLVEGIRLEEEVHQVVPPQSNLLGVVEELDQPRVVLVECRGRQGGGHPAGDEGGRVGVLAVHEAAHLPPQPGELDGLEIDRPGEGVHGVHDVLDGPVAMDVGVWSVGLRGPLDQLGVGHLDQGRRVVGAGQQAQVDRVVVEHLRGLTEVADAHTHGRGPHAEGHVQPERGDARVDPTTDPTGPGADVDRVPGIPALEDDLVAPEQHGHGMRVDDLPAVEVHVNVDGQSPGNPGHRVDHPLPNPGRGGDSSPDRGRPLRKGLRPLLQGVGIGHSLFHVSPPLLVKLDRQILETHGPLASSTLP